MRSSINFKEIFENYNSNLLNKLRGFGENKEYEFLQLWVPEENKFKIFINLLIVISEQKIPNIQFQIDQDFVKEEKILFDKVLNKKFLSLKLFSDKNNYFIECKEILENDINNTKYFFRKYSETKVSLNIEKIELKEEDFRTNNKLLSVEKSKDFISFKQKSFLCR